MAVVWQEPSLPHSPAPDEFLLSFALALETSVRMRSPVAKLPEWVRLCQDILMSHVYGSYAPVLTGSCLGHSILVHHLHDSTLTRKTWHPDRRRLRRGLRPCIRPCKRYHRAKSHPTDTLLGSWAGVSREHPDLPGRVSRLTIVSSSSGMP